MSDKSQAVFEAAMALSERDRAQLIQRLTETLSAEHEDVWDEKFAQELERRSAEFEQDPSCGIPWEQVKRELQAEVDGHDSSPPGA